jgi:hypothetical protein
MYKRFVFFIFLLTLFGFKMSIIGDTGDTGDNLLSSIRIDDLMIILFLAYYSLNNGGWAIFLKQKAIFIFMIYILFGVFSSLYNSAIGRVSIASSLLFSIRPLEYFVYIAVGFELSRLKVSINKTFKVYIVYCLILISGQSSGIIGGFSSFSFNRAIANTGGPWELAGVAAFMLCYFFNERQIIYMLLSGGVLILTQSRITLVGTLVVIPFTNLKLLSLLLKRKITILFTLCFLAAILSVFLYINISAGASGKINVPDVTSRVEQFLSNDTLSKLVDIYIHTDAAISHKDYFDKTYGESVDNIISSSGDGDASAFIRFTRWITLIKTANGRLDSFLIGLGPSYAGKAVDGNYVRLFSETGIIGLVLYIMFLFKFVTTVKERVLRNYTLILIITALFIDIFVTHKAMFLFWLYYGYILNSRESNRIA